MKEQLARIPQPERPAPPERSANESGYGSIEVDIDLTQTLADIEKLEQTLATPPIKESLPEGFPDLETAHVEEVIAVDPHRLTRWHFTKEGIEAAREAARDAEFPKKVVEVNTPRGMYPEDWKIEPHLRVPTVEMAADGLPKNLPPPPPLIPPKKPLTRADFPGTGKATMPELVYKKTAPPKKSFFRKLIPNFLSRFF